MDFDSMNFDQKSQLLNAYLGDYLSVSPADPRRFLNAHPELRTPNAAKFALEKGKSGWMFGAATANNETAMNGLRFAILALTISTSINNDKLAALAADFLVRKHLEIGDEANAAEWNIEAQKYSNCASSTYQDKTRLIAPLADKLGASNSDPAAPTRYLDAHRELINTEVMTWALKLAEAYFNGYEYTKRDIYWKCAMNLAGVAYLVARELKEKAVGIAASELQINLGQSIGAPQEVIFEFRQHIDWLQELPLARVRRPRRNAMKPMVARLERGATKKSTRAKGGRAKKATRSPRKKVPKRAVKKA